AYGSFPLGPWRPTNLRQSGRGHADACGGIENGAFLLEQQAYSLLPLALNHSKVSSFLPPQYSSYCYIRLARYGSTQSGQYGPNENNQSQSKAKTSLWSRLQG
ncbi:Uncharacterized protein DAT39_004512, partial [Clarias magur]